MDESKKEQARFLVRELIELIGDDPTREGLAETPDRVIRSWGELFSGYREDVTQHTKVFTAHYDQIVSVRNIDFFSTCEHHMLPFYGRCHIAYLPNGENKVLGVSKFSRIVNTFSRRLQIQEVLTQQVADAIQTAIEPRGVAVIMDAVHLCMVARGAKQQHASMRTSVLLGVFRDQPATRSEVLRILLEV